uniref:Uncharacterized protein n=1 Tax=Entomoneis paludosa TaxID=265537 RepID=A0A7S2VCY7_9STRA
MAVAPLAVATIVIDQQQPVNTWKNGPLLDLEKFLIARQSVLKLRADHAEQEEDSELFRGRAVAATPKKRVQFESRPTAWIPRPFLTCQDIHNSWYSRDDYYSFQQSSSHLIRTCRKRNSRASAAWQAESGIQLLQELFEQAFCQDSGDVDDTENLADAAEWLYQQDNCCGDLGWDLIGLEYAVSSSILSATRLRKQKLRSTVFELQNIYGRDVVYQDHVQEELREACREISRGSIWVAHQLAKAQLQLSTVENEEQLR